MSEVWNSEVTQGMRQGRSLGRTFLSKSYSFPPSSLLLPTTEFIRVSGTRELNVGYLHGSEAAHSPRRQDLKKFGTRHRMVFS